MCLLFRFPRGLKSGRMFVPLSWGLRVELRCSARRLPRRQSSSRFLSCYFLFFLRILRAPAGPPPFGFGAGNPGPRPKGRPAPILRPKSGQAAVGLCTGAWPVVSVPARARYASGRVHPCGRAGSARPGLALPGPRRWRPPTPPRRPSSGTPGGFSVSAPPALSRVLSAGRVAAPAAARVAWHRGPRQDDAGKAQPLRTAWRGHDPARLDTYP